MAFWNRDKHKRIKDNLSAYLDGRLNPKQAAEVEAHLESCAECAWEKQTLEQTRRLVQMAPRVAVPRSFILSPAQVEKPARRSPLVPAPLMALRTATAAVGILLAFVIAGDLWLRPLAPAPVAAPMVGAPLAPSGDMYAFGVTPEPSPTEESVMKLAAAPQPETPTPEAQAEGTAAAVLPADVTRAGEPEATPPPEAAAQGVPVRERGEVRTPVWAEVWVWRAAEGALGAMFVALLVITVTGWRRVARM
ncbi:MAG: zf-HC2 domain-containing protein [Anaerolineae bacterium]|jgi:predicted anti-sigma-YlaC factor YlaD|nr:zf-HC2 domain-containing protein [Anaerolineae bacterium]